MVVASGNTPRQPIFPEFASLMSGCVHQINSVNKQINNMNAEILLVDDNAVQAATRQAILALNRRTVAVADSAYRALEMLEDPELFNSIELVITDHFMPDLNGPQFVSLLRRRLPSIPVLVLSGLPDAGEEYTNLGVVFRTKPILPDQLLSLVDSFLDQPMSRTA
jgi:CheY-like chemotaxis protein